VAVHQLRRSAFLKYALDYIFTQIHSVTEADIRRQWDPCPSIAWVTASTTASSNRASPFAARRAPHIAASCLPCTVAYSSALLWTARIVPVCLHGRGAGFIPSSPTLVAGAAPRRRRKSLDCIEGKLHLSGAAASRSSALRSTHRMHRLPGSALEVSCARQSTRVTNKRNFVRSAKVDARRRQARPSAPLSTVTGRRSMPPLAYEAKCLEARREDGRPVHSSVARALPAVGSDSCRFDGRGALPRRLAADRLWGR
jgi:hypothetical protein